MDERELERLLRDGAPLTLVIEAIDWPHQAPRRGWDLARWRHAEAPGMVLLWRVAEDAPPETETARRLRDLGRERAEALAAVERWRRGPRGINAEDGGLQRRVNQLDWELAELRPHPDAPPEVRARALAGKIANLRRHRSHLREGAAMYRRAPWDLPGLADRQEAEAGALDAQIAALEVELAAIPAPAPLAGILCVNADASRRDEYAPTAGEAGYPVALLMRGEYTPGPARTALDAVADGLLR